MQTPLEAKHSITDDEMYQAQNEQLHRWDEEISGKNTTVLSTAYQSGYGSLEAAVKTFIASNDPMYTLAINKWKRTIYKGTPLSLYTGSMRNFIQLYKPDIKYSPYIELFFNAVERLQLWHEQFKSPDAESSVPGKKVAQVLNELVELIRQEAQSDAFKKSVARRQENSTKKLRSTRGYIDQLFAWCPKLLVLRVDLEYKADLKPAITIGEARKDLRHLLNNRLKNKIFNRMGGYIWSLEYGGRGGSYHYHIAFFFDSAIAEIDPYLAWRIGNYWVHTVTKGRGAYYNCNRDKEGFSHLNRLGIGIIEKDDWEKRKALDLVVQYMTKKDACLKPKFDEGRVFGKGENPPINTIGVNKLQKSRSKQSVVKNEPSETQMQIMISLDKW